MIGGGGRSRSSAGKCVICEGATSGKCVKPAPNWLIFWGLFAPLAAVVVIERLDKPSSNVSILFLFGIIDHRILCHFGTLRCPKICHRGYSPAADGWIKRTMSAVDFRDKTRPNRDRVDEKKTKKRRKNDVENEVDEGKKLCPIFGTLSHLWYIKNNTNRVLDRAQSRRRSPTI